MPDGTPKYYADKVFPIDAQSVAQGIQTLSIAAPARRLLRDRGLERVPIRRASHAGRGWPARSSSGGACGRTGAHHVRWVVAPMLLALTHLLALDRAPNAQRREGERVAA